jgi:hypothetical protein
VEEVLLTEEKRKQIEASFEERHQEFLRELKKDVDAYWRMVGEEDREQVERMINARK